MGEEYNTSVDLTSKRIAESIFNNSDYFTERQKQLIESMLSLKCKNIIDLFGNAADHHEYKTFLRNQGITPQKEKEINIILESHIDLNPNTAEGFNTSKLQELKNHFYTNNAKLLSMPRRPSSHTITSRPKSIIIKPRSSTNKGKNGGKTKKKKKKNKKKKRKSYKK